MTTRARFALALTSLLLPATSWATTVVVPTDGSLVRSADLVVVATVGERLAADGTSRPHTDYWVEVDRVLKGELAGSALILRNPGGVAADGMELKIWGVPEFAPGERAILFLNRGRDGLYRIAHTVLGAFRETRLGGRAVAYRDLSDVDVLNSGDLRENGSSPLRQQRDFEMFAAWIADTAAGVRRHGDYFFRTGEASLNTLLPMFTLLTEDGKNMRWFEFDQGRSVSWRIDADPLGGFSGSAVTPFQNALAAWNNEPRTPIRYNYAGTSTDTTGFQEFDDLNVLLFDDPNGDVEDTFSCTEGGTLAIGGPWFSSRTTARFNNETFIRIQGADIVFNDGLDCFFQRTNAAGVAELMGHELGHTLGLSHSSESADETNATLRDALMYFRIHNDSRGASLRSDDLAGIRRLYEAGSGGGGTGGGGASGCGLDKLCLLNNRFEVSLTWTNQFDGSTGSGLALPFSNFAGFFHFSPDPRNIEIVVKIVDFDGRILVFYSELTVIQFRMQVRDTLTGKMKEYTNTNRDCGAIDTNFVDNSGTVGFISGGPPTVIRDLGITQSPGQVCRSGQQRLCLLRGRFEVTLPTWRNQYDGSTGSASALPINDLTGGFHFSADPRNLEVLFKINEFPDRILVFYSSLTDVEFSIRLTDTSTGRTTEFANPTGSYCGGFVNNLLAGPPFQ